MQLLATAEQMRRFDREAIARFRVPGMLLMENAGRGFVEVLERRVGAMVGKEVLVVCGKGNNGGDGFVIARHLANRGAKVSVLLVGKRGDVKGDARTNLAIVLKLAEKKTGSISFSELKSVRQLGRPGKPDLIVDAIFGTGFSGPVQGIQRKVVEWINRSELTVATVDIPSGVNATTGVVESVAVKASITATMGLAKVGHFVGSGRDHSGKVDVVDIGIPQVVYQPSHGQTYRVLAASVKASLPQRPISAHKHSVGKVFVIAGSRGFTGAPYMCAQAAMKSGAGAVVLAVPQSIHLMMARKATEVIVVPLAETAEGTLAVDAMAAMEEKVQWADVVVVGPGLSRNEDTQKLVATLILSIRKPLIVDADALFAVAGKKSILKQRKDETVLTPHVGELSRIIGRDGKEIEEHRVEVARSSARALGAIVVLKGAPTVTAVDDGSAYLNSTGNPGMATAGAGDVLAGIIAALVGQGLSPGHAAIAGVYVHGLAGDLAGTEFGQRGMMAMDVLDRIPAALLSLQA